MKFLEHELAYRRATQNSLSRRDALMKMGGGFGSLGLASLIGSANGSTNDSSPLAPKRPHFQPKAKRIIQLFMPGGPSQVDTFDHKPMLAKHAGERPLHQGNDGQSEYPPHRTSHFFAAHAAFSRRILKTRL